MGPPGEGLALMNLISHGTFNGVAAGMYPSY